MLKKILLGVLTAVLLLTFTACDSRDYNEAVNLFQSGRYDEALTIFQELGDYQDSPQRVLQCKYSIARDYFKQGKFNEAEAIFGELADYEDSREYLEQIPWKKFHKYIKDSGGVEIVNPDPAYSVVLSAPGEDILVTYHMESRTTGMEAEIEFSAVLEAGNSVSDLTAHSKLWLLSASTEDQGSAAWNIHDYKKGDGLIWSEYSCSGKKMDGSSLDTGAKGMCYSSAEVQLERMVGGIARSLEESGLGLQMSDIGFASY